MPTPKYDPAETKLIAARVDVMKRDPALGDLLCRYVFQEGFKVATLARDRRQIVYRRAFVLQATREELVEFLLGIARRAPRQSDRRPNRA